MLVLHTQKTALYIPLFIDQSCFRCYFIALQFPQISNGLSSLTHDVDSIQWVVTHKHSSHQYLGSTHRRPIAKPGRISLLLRIEHRTKMEQMWDTNIPNTRGQIMEYPMTSNMHATRLLSE